MNGAEQNSASVSDAVAARQALYRKHELHDGVKTISRSERFRRRSTNEYNGYDFGSFAALPLWSLQNDQDSQALAYAAGLIYFRKQLDRELDGAILRSLAAKTGEGLLDKVMDAGILDDEYLATSDLPLPLPDEIHQTGQCFVEAAISGSDHKSKVARKICAHAHEIVDCSSPKFTENRE